MLALHLPTLQKRSTEVSAIMQRIETDGGKAVKHKELRASAFPVCPLTALYAWLVPTESYQNSYHSKYHTSVGHVLHAYMQERVARAGKGLVLGDWSCPQCSETSLDAEGNTVYKPVLFATTDQTCPHCGGACSYEELAVRLGKGKTILTGHIDGVLVFPQRKNAAGNLYVPLQVFDYKTCSLADAANLPVKKHLLQLAIYVVLLEYRLTREWGLPVVCELASILYIPKDKPTKFSEYAIEFSASLREEARSMVTWALEGFDVLAQVREFALRPVAEKQQEATTLLELLDDLYWYRTCNPESQPGEDMRARLVSAIERSHAAFVRKYPDRRNEPPPPVCHDTFYEHAVKPLFFEKIENPVTDKATFVNRCPYDKSCSDCKHWTADIYQRILYEEYDAERKPADTSRLAKSRMFTDLTPHRPKRGNTGKNP